MECTKPEKVQGHTAFAPYSATTLPTKILLLQSRPVLHLADENKLDLQKLPRYAVRKLNQYDAGQPWGAEKFYEEHVQS